MSPICNMPNSKSRYHTLKKKKILKPILHMKKHKQEGG